MLPLSFMLMLLLSFIAHSFVLSAPGQASDRLYSWTNLRVCSCAFGLVMGHGVCVSLREGLVSYVFNALPTTVVISGQIEGGKKSERSRCVDSDIISVQLALLPLSCHDANGKCVILSHFCCHPNVMLSA